MKLKHLKELDLDSIKKNIKKNNDNLSNSDEKLITKALGDDITDEVDKHLILEYFKERRMMVVFTDKMYCLCEKIQRRYNNAIYKAKGGTIGHFWINYSRWDLCNFYRQKFKEAYKEKFKQSFLVVQDVFDMIGCTGYSISHGDSRLIDTCHFSKVIAYALSKELKVGYLIFKSPRKYCGYVMRQTPWYDKTYFTLRCMKIIDVLEAIETFTNIKPQIYKEEDGIKKAKQQEVLNAL